MNARHTNGPWEVVETTSPSGWIVTACESQYDICIVRNGSGRPENKANAWLIAAAPELSDLAHNFEITGPDADGLLWLVLHGAGTSGRAMFNLGKADQLAGEVALLLEEQRRAAIAKATGSAS